MKKIIPLVLFFGFFASFTLFAQQKNANIVFNEEKHDFGEIKEADGLATTEFEFTNTGGEPLMITSVRPSCGCTSPSYTKEPVMPGEKGKITVAFNPKNRSGKFNKTITVYSNSSTQKVILTISGLIIPKPIALPPNTEPTK